MRLPGVVSNVANFGAFVDIGVHQDGLVHISHLADRFVQDPRQVVKVQQKVMVTVLEVDLARKRIALSMRSDPFAERGAATSRPEGAPRGEKRREKSPAAKPAAPPPPRPFNDPWPGLENAWQ